MRASRNAQKILLSTAMVSLLVLAACSGGAEPGPAAGASHTGRSVNDAGLGAPAAAGGAGTNEDTPRGGSAGSTGGVGVGGVGGAGPGAGGSGGGPGDTGAPPNVGSGDPGALVTYGQTYQGGQYHIGPVDWAETEWHNACAPDTKYAPAIRSSEGMLLAGLPGTLAGVAGYCDACIHVTTAMGQSATLRVVTYGVTAPNSIDVSPEAYQLLNRGEYPRAMTWQFVKCPDTGKIVYEFQPASSEDWTSLWVRNGRVPIKSVDVKSAKHPAYVALARGSDGTLTDTAGFGKGPFSIRLTGIDGQQVVDSFGWPGGGIGGQSLSSPGNFK